MAALGIADAVMVIDMGWVSGLADFEFEDNRVLAFYSTQLHFLPTKDKRKEMSPW
jgi:hypothetical protein